MQRCAPDLLLAFAVGATLSACSDGRSSTDPAALRPTAAASTERSASDAETRTFTTVDVPGASNTLALDINDGGVIVGRYLGAGHTHGFVRQTTGELATIDFPGAGFTVAAAINRRGDIVGQYALPTAPTARHGYLRTRNGEFASFDPPGSTFTNVLGINDRGDIVGRFCTLAKCRNVGSGDYRGFLLRGVEFTILDFPGASETDAFKINDRRQIVGVYAAPGKEELFVSRKGKFTALALPGGMPVSADNGGINSHGDIVGLYCDGAPPSLIAPTGTHGFVLSGDDFTTIDFPGSSATSAIGINARRDVVGAYFDASGVAHGFLLNGRERDPKPRID
jgi:uncharacterized membrane protein